MLRSYIQSGEFYYDPVVTVSARLDHFRKGGNSEWRRWQKERVTRVVTQDLRDLENIKEISLIELLVDLLNPKVSSMLSIKSLQEDLQVSPNTVTKYGHQIRSPNTVTKYGHQVAHNS